jgi:predicted phosphohydrolase
VPKLIWVSDIHLNFLSGIQRNGFYEQLKGYDVVISGDIGESVKVFQYIEEMESVTGKSVFFVLGNHDYYGSSLKKVRRQAKKYNWLQWAPVELNRETLLLGVDGWGDGRNGDYEGSRLVMADWLYIEELFSAYSKGSVELLGALQKIADGDARLLRKNVKKALQRGYRRFIIVSHVPPFEEASLYAGKKSNPDGLPFFSSKVLGELLLPVIKKHPEVDFLWLCGHTHSRVTYKPCENLIVKVAKAEYHRPQIEEILDV